MLKHLVVTDGLDPLTKPVVDYLARNYGMPLADIRTVVLESTVGGIQTITVTVMVRAGEEIKPSHEN